MSRKALRKRNLCNSVDEYLDMKIPLCSRPKVGPKFRKNFSKSLLKAESGKLLIPKITVKFSLQIGNSGNFYLFIQRLWLPKTEKRGREQQSILGVSFI
jgi:hypothetical protein